MQHPLPLTSPEKVRDRLWRKIFRTARKQSPRAGRLLAGFIVVSLLNFFIPRMMPGSPVYAILGPDAVSLSEKDVVELETALGLKDPMAVQLIRHFSDMLRLDFGFSYHFQQPVSNLLKASILPTLTLLIPSVLLSAILSCLSGALAGRFSGRMPDLILTSLFLFLYTIPVFLLAMIALDLFSLRFDLFPLGALGNADVAGDFISRFSDRIRHLFLPVTVLTLSSTAVKYMVMRNSVCEGKNQNFVLYARARGISEKRILFVHLLRYASLPLVSLVGLHFAFILSGSLLVEIVFSINGMGNLIHEAAINRDYPVLQASFLFLTCAVLTVNIVTDIIYNLLDPRIQGEG